MYLLAIRYIDAKKIITYRCLQVSGEYSMLVRGAESGLFNLDVAVMEALHSFRRAGTDVIISYFTPRVLENLQNMQEC